MQPSRLWWSQLRIPLAIFVVTATVFALTPLDEHIAGAVFFDSASAQWIGGHSWVINELLHTGGRWAIRAIVAIALAFWGATFVKSDWREFRRPVAFFTVSAVLSMGLVGLLKNVTNVDCPWDLVPFGGRFPYVELFADRPDALRAAHCFPAAHASSGYALLALYFVFRERYARLAKLGLAVGLLTGLTFGLVQQGAARTSSRMTCGVRSWSGRSRCPSMHSRFGGGCGKRRNMRQRRCVGWLLICTLLATPAWARTSAAGKSAKCWTSCARRD